jgi:hypothetical protein
MLDIGLKIECSKLNLSMQYEATEWVYTDSIQ